MIQALNDVRAKMADVTATLPPGTTTVVERQTPSVFPIISFVVTGGRDPAALYDYAYYDLRPRVCRIPDVSYVTVQGGDVREIVVEVEPERAGRRRPVAGGRGRSVGQRAPHEGRGPHGPRSAAVPGVDEHADCRSRRSWRTASSPRRTASRSAWRDLGRVIVSHEDRTMAIRADGQRCRRVDGLSPPGRQRPDGFSRARRDAGDGRPTRPPPGIRIVPVYDQALLVRTAIDNVRDAILVGGLFSVLILLMFLKSVRATLLAAISIPLSLMISFFFLRLTGDTLNLMSLGGLAVAIGLIIDDSVVVVENIARHIAEGQKGDAAIAAASREISGAVIGSTLTTILVFVPLAFVRGVVGQFFQSLSLALSVALLVSMVISLTSCPCWPPASWAGGRCRTAGRSTTFWRAATKGLLRVGLRFPRMVIVLALLAVVPAWWLSSSLKAASCPRWTKGPSSSITKCPSGTSLAQTDAVLRRVEALLRIRPR